MPSLCCFVSIFISSAKFIEEPTSAKLCSNSSARYHPSHPTPSSWALTLITHPTWIHPSAQLFSWEQVERSGWFMVLGYCLTLLAFLSPTSITLPCFKLDLSNLYLSQHVRSKCIAKFHTYQGPLKYDNEITVSILTCCVFLTHLPCRSPPFKPHPHPLSPELADESQSPRGPSQSHQQNSTISVVS